MLIEERYRLIRPLQLHPLNQHEVWEVEDLKGTNFCPPGGHQVLKILKFPTLQAAKKFDREIQILKTFAHPGMPRCDYYGTFTFLLPGELIPMKCMVIQFIPGITLRQWLKTHGQINSSQAVVWLKQIVEILREVNRERYFHGDIKPDNIMVQPDNQLVLIDWGGAQVLDDEYMAKLSSGIYREIYGDSPLILDATVSIGYTAPEQAEGKPLPQSDFYALGQTFLELLTGQSPIYINSDPQTGRLLWHDSAAKTDPALVALIDQMISPNIVERPINAELLLQMLNHLPGREQKIAKPRNLWIGGIALALLTSLGVFGVISRNLSKVEAADYLSQADLSKQVQDLPSARRLYEQSLRLNPNQYPVLVNLAMVCAQMEDFECATRKLEQAIRIESEPWQAYYNLGVIYELRDDMSAARQSYQQAIATGKNKAAGALNNLARLEILEGNPQAALALIADGLQKTKDRQYRWALLKNQGWAYLIQGNYPQAQKSLLEAVKLDPAWADPYCLLVQVAQKQGQSGQEYWSDCLSEASEVPEVRAWRQQIFNRLLSLKKS
ncbi:MAG: tetratricopeptide repeat protein [Aphanocapsa sp. GSE-SYN-MK-11-07L]|nr:tetratricopeptide repeat protein [Aphanocapsa sp. GSE-SYN-MK-11-07L]